MVIKYSNIQTLKKLFSKGDLYNYWFNFIIKKFNTYLPNISKQSNLEIRFFRFFFWLFLSSQSIGNNFLLFYKKFKYSLLYFKLLVYLKKSNVNFYNLIYFNKLLFIKKLNFLLLDRNISIIFVYNYTQNLNYGNKVICIKNLDFKLVKLYNYFLINI